MKPDNTSVTIQQTKHTQIVTLREGIQQRQQCHRRGLPHKRNGAPRQRRSVEWPRFAPCAAVSRHKAALYRKRITRHESRPYSPFTTNAVKGSSRMTMGAAHTLPPVAPAPHITVHYENSALRWADFPSRPARSAPSRSRWHHTHAS